MKSPAPGPGREPGNRNRLTDSLTTGQVARLVGCSAKTVQHWCDDGRLAHHRLPFSGDRRIAADVLAEFLAAHGIPVPAVLKQLSEPTPQAVESLPAGGATLSDELRGDGEQPADR